MKHLTPARMVLAGLLLGIVLAVSVFGAERVWGLFGPADLGGVEFETLERRASPNDALVCPAGFCRARSDRVAPDFAVEPRALFERIPSALAGEGRLQLVAEDQKTLTRRYVQRTALLGFPDTIVVKVVERPGRQSSVAMYSRSKIGYSDLGANKARLERWLGLVAKIAGPGR